MKQIVQNFKTGETKVEEVPVPIVKNGHLLIKTTRSLVSLGTERMLVDFGNANLLQKARQQPDKVRLVIDKIKNEGLFSTIEAVMNKLDFPIPLGYSNVGIVEEIGANVSGFNKGDRVVSNGPHAEYVLVPENLCMNIPDNVSDDDASFTIIASIGLQGVRLVNPTFGETVVVYGLGLIGLLTAQLLKANGCNVIGIDIDEEKLNMASGLKIESINPKNDDIVSSVLSKTDSVGADAVIITASAKTNEIITNSAQMSRKRGRIILVGVTGLNLNRSDYYEKELSFQVSCSYGPGRYDPVYEDQGHDYPLPLVRWTEKRNFEAILTALDQGRLSVNSFISDLIPFDDFQKIYADISNSRAIAQILTYENTEKIDRTVLISEKLPLKKEASVLSSSGVAIIGAGNFTQMTVLPQLDKLALKQTSVIVSSKGLNAKSLAKKYSIKSAATDLDEVIQNKEIGALLITTRHNEHAEQVIKGLENGKHIFVEKPLALSNEEISRISSAFEKINQSKLKLTLNVGFNRRFSPYIQKMKELLGVNVGPISLIATMNAGFIPKEVWVHDPIIGGGRILGEACHFIDLAVYLTGSKVASICMNALGVFPSINADTGSIQLKFENGSIAVINYFANGNKSYQKERVEVFDNGRTMIMDNFSRLELFGYKGKRLFKGKQDKGHKTQFNRWFAQLRSDNPQSLIPYDDIINVSRATVFAVQSMQNRQWIDVKTNN